MFRRNFYVKCDCNGECCKVNIAGLLLLREKSAHLLAISAGVFALQFAYDYGINFQRVQAWLLAVPFFSGMRFSLRFIRRETTMVRYAFAAMVVFLCKNKKSGSFPVRRRILQ